MAKLTKEELEEAYERLTSIDEKYTDVKFEKAKTIESDEDISFSVDFSSEENNWVKKIGSK